MTLGGDPRRAALLGFAGWFGIQAAVAVWGLASGMIGGLTWLAVFADPLIAMGFVALSRRARSGRPRGQDSRRLPAAAH